MEAALAARLKDAARLLAPAVAQTIAGLDLTGKDAAAVKLARGGVELNGPQAYVIEILAGIVTSTLPCGEP